MNPVNGSGMKRAALLNDLSCFGKCSLTVAAPVVSAWGVEAVPLPTAVLSAQTAFPGYIMRDFTREMEEFSAQWETLGLEFDCIYTGFFANGAQIDFARRFIERFAKDDTLILADPVLGDNGALYGCFGPEQVEKMRQLCRMAHVITPNRTEAALLAGLPADTPAEELLAALRTRLEVENTIVTGVCRKNEIGYLARLGEREMSLQYPRVAQTLHGTGDVFAAALCGALLSCGEAPAALRQAAEFCNACVEKTAQRQPAHWYGLAFEDVLKERSGL